MMKESPRTCPICGNELSGALEFCPVCLLRKGLAGGVESGQSSSGDTVKPILAEPAQREFHRETNTMPPSAPTSVQKRGLAHGNGRAATPELFLGVHRKQL